MYIKNPRLVRNTLYSGLKFVVPTFLMLIFTPLLVHQMGTANYGLWTISISIVGVIGVAEFGLGIAIAKYLAEYVSINDDEGISVVITLGFSVFLVIGIFVTVPLYFFAPLIAQWFSSSSIHISDVESVVKVSSFGLFPLMLRSGGMAVPIGLQRFGFPALLTIIQQILILITAFLISYFGGSVQLIVMGTILGMWVTAFVSLMIAFHLLKPFNVRIHASREYLRKMIFYSLSVGLSSLGGRFFNIADKLVVGAVLGIEAVTYYTVIIGIANKLLSFSGSLTEILMPAVSSLIASGEVEQVKHHMKRATLGVVLLNLIVAGGLFLISSEFLQRWMGVEFAKQALNPFRVLIVVYALISVSAPAYHIANGIGSPWINAIGSLSGGILSIGLILFLGRNGDLIDVAWANAGYLLNWILPLYIVYKLFTMAKGTGGQVRLSPTHETGVWSKR